MPKDGQLKEGMLGAREILAFKAKRAYPQPPTPLTFIM